MATIDNGVDYLYKDFVDNIVYILNENKVKLGIRFIGTFKDFLASTFPSIYVVFDNATDEWVSMPRIKDITMMVVLHYYHRHLNKKVQKEEIDLMLGKITYMLTENHSCNGFLNTQEGMSAESADAMGELRGELGGVGDGLIVVKGVKRIRIVNIK